MLPHIVTPNALTIYVGMLPISYASGTLEYEKALTILHDSFLTDEEKTAELQDLGRVRTAAFEERLAKIRQIAPDLEYDEATETLIWRGEELHTTLAQRLLKLHLEQLDTAPLVRFLENLSDNPSYRVVEHLYEFLEYGKIPITSDGHFLVYKAVRSDFKDIHSGRFDNSIGQVVQIPRNKVDENPDNTCSYGLHVCSYEYLPSFAHCNGHVVVCKVNPKDVVAIPRDYNNTKMRVCRYEVVGEVEGWYEQRSNFLSDSPFNDSYDNDLDNPEDENDENSLATNWDMPSLALDAPPTLADLAEPGRYEVRGHGKFSIDETVLGVYGTITDALRILQTYMGDPDYDALSIRDAKNDTVRAIFNNETYNA